MAEFLTPLDIGELGEDHWRLLRPLKYQTDLLTYLQRIITVPGGFETDLESVPRWLTLAYAVLYGTAHKASVVHDWLYTGGLYDREKDDAILYEAILATGQPRWKAWMIWSGVRMGGWVAWDAHQRSKN